MGVNRRKPHVFVLPEDDANSRLANGFHLEVDGAAFWQMDVLPSAGGWTAVIDRFLSDHVQDMNRYPGRYMVLLIDFDGKQQRLNDIKARIPGHLKERVFVLGTWTEPEALKAADLGSYEAIGKAMAQNCREGTVTIWDHALLRHNSSELDRLRQEVCPILFPTL
jgi:hypothetical protein